MSREKNKTVQESKTSGPEEYLDSRGEWGRDPETQWW